MIVTNGADRAIDLFEAPEFEKSHLREWVLEDVSQARMKDENGFHVNVVQAPAPETRPTIRMNVDLFEEAIERLPAHGFTSRDGGQTSETGSSEECTLYAPSGL